MALEALNDAGCSNTNLIVILNDNEMSISKNVGGIAMILGKVRTKKIYTKSNNYVKRVLHKIPKVGDFIVEMSRKIKNGIKQFLIPNMFFEDLGFRYLGPINGNDIEKVEDILKMAKKLQGPVLVHIITKKGKGYKFAEQNPDKYHGISSFDIETGKTKKEKKDDYSKIFGEKLVDLAKKNEKIVAITAAMADGTGLKKFKQEFPKRFFDVGIAEQHALGLAAGMAKQGLIPVVSIYSSFYQRAYDQVIHDICIQKLPVVMCVDRAGIVGNDGETHQGIFDMAFFSIVPNLSILAPKDFKELEQMLEFAVSLNKPVVIRYPRGGEGKIKFKNHPKLEYGKCEIVREGTNLTIVAIGKMVERAIEVSNCLKDKGIEAEVINVRFLKPLDGEKIVSSITKTGKVITIEDGTMRSGLATSISELLVKNKMTNIDFKAYGYDDKFVKHGNTDELERINKLDVQSIVSDLVKENKMKVVV